jgi:hypothetical protein
MSFEEPTLLFDTIRMNSAFFLRRILCRKTYSVPQKGLHRPVSSTYGQQSCPGFRGNRRRIARRPNRRPVTWRKSSAGRSELSSDFRATTIGWALIPRRSERSEGSVRKETSKMAVGPVTFSLEPANTGNPQAFPAEVQQDAAADYEGVAPPIQGTREGLLPPPLVPYAPGPGTYTHLWMSQTSTMTREDIKEELSSYLDAYSGSGTPDYSAIQATILTSGDWYGFLTVLPDHQVCLVHSLGKHSSGLGRPASAHNRIFGLLGEKVEDQLPPLVMVPSAGLLPWLKIQNVHQRTPEDLQDLANQQSKTVLRPQLTSGTEDQDEDNDRPQVPVQNLCFIPKPWAAQFLAPMSPWGPHKRSGPCWQACQ